MSHQQPLIDDDQPQVDQEPMIHKGSRDDTRRHIRVAIKRTFEALEQLRLLREDAPKDILNRMAECHLIASTASLELARIAMRKRRVGDHSRVEVPEGDTAPQVVGDSSNRRESSDSSEVGQ